MEAPLRNHRKNRETLDQTPSFAYCFNERIRSTSSGKQYLESVTRLAAEATTLQHIRNKEI